jgi:hypothetical protein
LSSISTAYTAFTNSLRRLGVRHSASATANRSWSAARHAAGAVSCHSPSPGQTCNALHGTLAHGAAMRPLRSTRTHLLPAPQQPAQGSHPGCVPSLGPTPCTHRAGQQRRMTTLLPSIPCSKPVASLPHLNMQRPSPATRTTRSPVSAAGPAAALQTCRPPRRMSRGRGSWQVAGREPKTVSRRKHEPFNAKDQMDRPAAP